MRRRLRQPLGGQLFGASRFATALPAQNQLFVRVLDRGHMACMAAGMALKAATAKAVRGMAEKITEQTMLAKRHGKKRLCHCRAIGHARFCDRLAMPG